MTQHEKILRYLVNHPQSGMTIRDGVIKLNINWTHKRVAELEQMGVRVRRITDERDGVRFRRYILNDPNQDRVRELLELYGGKK